MLAVPASLLDLDMVFLDVGEHSPAKQVFAPKHAEKAHINGSFSDPDKVKELAVLRRSAIVNQLYGGWRLVVEKQQPERERGST